MAIFKTRWFDRWARKQGLTVDCLCAAVVEMSAGQYEAALGGGLLKKRIARLGQGKRGGFRALVATNRNDRWIFVFGFSKNVRGNISVVEETALKLLAEHLLALTALGLEQAQSDGELMELHCDEKGEFTDS